MKMKKIQFKQDWEVELTKKYVINHDELTPQGKKVSATLFELEEFRRRYGIGFYQDENIDDEINCLIQTLKDLKKKSKYEF